MGATTELKNYLAKNPHTSDFAGVLKQARVINKDSSIPAAPVPTLDVMFHRGTKQDRQCVSDPTVNQHQPEVNAAITGYMSGQISKDQFVSKLGEHNIQVD